MRQEYKLLSEEAYGKILLDLSLREGKTTAAVEADMREAIEAAWDGPNQGAWLRQQKLFPGGRAPTPRELISVMSVHALERREN